MEQLQETQTHAVGSATRANTANARSYMPNGPGMPQTQALLACTTTVLTLASPKLDAWTHTNAARTNLMVAVQPCPAPRAKGKPNRQQPNQQRYVCCLLPSCRRQHATRQHAHGRHHERQTLRKLADGCEGDTPLHHAVCNWANL
jgi:hypothetical protein